MSELIDNRAQRVRTLKGIIKRLHAGDAPDEVRASLKELVCQTDYSEVMAMEQELIADGMPVEEIQGMCDLHSQVTREVLVQLAPPPVLPGHPVDTFRRENEALRQSIARLQRAMNGVLETADDGNAAAPLLEWRQALNELQDVDKHYQRKEHLLFTCLERHGITGPSKVMWGKDDQIRELLKDLSAALREADTTVAEWKLLAATTGAAAASSVHEMIYKEEQILLPICLERFTADEWAEIWASSPRYGWCLVAPREGYKPVDLQPDRTCDNRRRFPSDRDARIGTTDRHLLHASGGPHVCGCRRPGGVLFGRSEPGFRAKPRHHRTHGSELSSSAKRGCSGADHQRLPGRPAKRGGVLDPVCRPIRSHPLLCGEGRGRPLLGNAGSHAGCRPHPRP